MRIQFHLERVTHHDALTAVETARRNHVNRLTGQVGDAIRTRMAEIEFDLSQNILLKRSCKTKTVEIDGFKNMNGESWDVEQ